MKRKRLLSLLCCLSGLLFAQNPIPDSSSSRPDFSAEAIVVEQLYLVSSFQDDGSALHRATAKFRVQSEAGVQQLGVLTMPYDQATGTIEISYVRVRKPDGSVVETPTDAAQDMPAPVTREAPIYSDLRQKHINVVGLRPGDVLEYEIINRVSKPLIPNHFWFDATLEKGLITIDQRVEVNVPSRRSIKLKVKPGFAPEIREENGRKIYLWSHTNLRRREVKPTREETLAEFTPDVQGTSFESWESFGQWFSGIQKDRVVPSPEVKAKATELTRSKQSLRDKVEAIYSFVSGNVRYIGLEFGIGRFQANQAANILANSYGDCKDKHTLLVAMLQVIGVTADPVLIHADRRLDADIPSPAQFNHVISTVTIDGRRFFLDTTTELAPFGMLLAGLRDKDALLVANRGLAEIVHTPADTPFPQFVKLDVSGMVDKDGTLKAQIAQSFRGDEELLFRVAFRHTPRDKWKDVAQNIAYMTGYGGEVSDVSVSNVEDTAGPLALKYNYTRQNYMTWNGESGGMRVALLAMQLPDPSAAGQSKDAPVRFGRRTELVYSGVLRLPEDVRATEPSRVNIARPYASYDSTYQLKGRELSVRRTLTLRTVEGPPLGSADYKSFFDQVSGDYSADLAVHRATRQAPAAASSPQQRASDPAADEAFRIGIQTMARGDLYGARTKYQEAVRLDPKHPYAWAELARTYLLLRDTDETLRYSRKQLEVNANHPEANLMLAGALALKGDKDGATAALKRQIEVSPDDQRGRLVLARLYMNDKNYRDIVPVLEPIATAEAADGKVLAPLGLAYLKVGNKEKAVDLFERWLKVDDKPSTKNSVAYFLADNDAYLDRALELVKEAIAVHSVNLHTVTLNGLTMANVNEVTQLVAAWDTLGWIYFKKGQIEQAKTYLHAAWVTEQTAEIAGHVAAVYAKLGMNTAASQYRSYESLLKPKTSISGSHPPINLPSTAKRNEARSGRSPEEALQEFRTVRLSQQTKKSFSSELFVLLSSTGAKEVRFITNPEAGVALRESLVAAKYPLELPDDREVSIVRRGILSCSEHSGRCMVVLIQPMDLKSLE